MLGLLLVQGFNPFPHALAALSEQAGRLADALKQWERYLQLVPNAPDRREVEWHIRHLRISLKR